MPFGGNRSVSVELRANVSNYVDRFRVATKSTQDLASAASKASVEHKEAYDRITRGAAFMGAGVGAGVVLAVKAFADFDKSMSRAAAATDATGKDLDRLRALALKLGADTQYSATEAADGITALAKAGVSVKDIIGGGLAGSLNLAAAGELDVAQASEIAATAMTQFGLAGKDLPHVADLLAAGAGKAQGDVTDLANAMKYVGPVSKGMGVSIEETTGALALFASQGIVSEQAGTSLRGLLSTLSAPSKAAATEMQKLGLSMYDVNGQFVGISGVAGQLQAALEDLTPAERDAALGRIFGNDQLTAARVLYEGGADAVDTWTKAVNDSGFAQRQASRLTDNLSGDFERLGGSIDTAFIGSGSGANDFLRSLVQGLESAVDAFNGLPAGAQQATLGIAAVTAGGLLLSAGLLKGIQTVTELRTSFRELSVSGEKAKGTLAAVGKAAGYLAAFETAAAGLGALEGDIADTTVSSNELTAALGRLNASKNDLATGSFGNGFADLGKQLKELADPSLGRRYKDIDSAVSGLVTFNQFGNTDGSQDRRQVLADLQSLDSALASLVQSGNTTEALKQFEQLNQLAVAGGAGVDQLAQHLPQYEDALVGVQNSTDGAAGAAGDWNEQTKRMVTSNAQAAASLEGLKDALSATNSLFLQGRDAERGYFEALDGITAALKDNGHTLDVHTEKGRANSEALDSLASSSLTYLQSILDQEGPGKKFTDTLAATRKSLIESATRLGMTKKQAQDYAAAILDVPTKQYTAFTSNVDAAITDADRLANTIRAKFAAPFTIKYVTQGAGTVLAPSVGTGDYVKKADGGLIPYGMGGPKQDNVLARVSSGEYVVNAAATSKHLPLIEAINAGKFAAGGLIGGLPAYASGGQVDAPYGSFLSRYEQAQPDRVDMPDVTGALRKQRDATEAVRLQEMRLRDLRRAEKPNRTAIAAAEDSLRKKRDALSAATAKLTATEKAAAAARVTNARATAFERLTPLQKFTRALTGGVKNVAAFIQNLQTIASRGYPQIAQQLAQMGDEDAERIAAGAARASTKDLQNLQNYTGAAVKQQQQLDNIDGITNVLAAVAKSRVTLAGLVDSTGLDIADLVTAVGLIRGQLAKTANAKTLLADVDRYNADRGIKRAGGGLIPYGLGTPRQDNVLVHASSGEFVVNAAATSKNRALLEAVNAGGRFAAASVTGPAMARTVSALTGAPQGAQGHTVSIGHVELVQGTAADVGREVIWQLSARG